MSDKSKQSLPLPSNDSSCWTTSVSMLARKGDKIGPKMGRNEEETGNNAASPLPVPLAKQPEQTAKSTTETAGSVTSSILIFCIVSPFACAAKNSVFLGPKSLFWGFKLKDPLFNPRTTDFGSEKQQQMSMAFGNNALRLMNP